jgi:hypothetical protein
MDFYRGVKLWLSFFKGFDTLFLGFHCQLLFVVRLSFMLVLVPEHDFTKNANLVSRYVLFPII